MAIRTDFIKAAYNKTPSKYKKVNAFKASAYSDLDDYYRKASERINKSYQEASDLLDGDLKTAEEQKTFGRKKAYGEYAAENREAAAKYRPFSNENGAFRSSLADRGLTKSGYAEVKRAEGFEEKQRALASAAVRLQQGLTALEGTYASAVKENADGKAKLALEQMNALQLLLSDVYQRLGQLSADVNAMDYNERELEFMKEKPKEGNRIKWLL